MKIETITINQLIIHEHHLDIIYSADKFNFSTKVFYHDLSFSLLTNKYSETVIKQISACIALFEGMKLCSLFPKYYDIGIIASDLSSSALELFLHI